MERGFSGYNGCGMRFHDPTQEQLHLDLESSQEFCENAVNWRQGSGSHSGHIGHSGLAPPQGGHSGLAPPQGVHSGLAPPLAAHSGLAPPQAVHSGMARPQHVSTGMTPSNPNAYSGMPPHPNAIHTAFTSPQPHGTQTSEHTTHGPDEELQEINGTQFAEDLENKKGVAHRGKAFKPQEDRVICYGWLNVSKDPVTGASQTGDAFYARLHRYYLENWDMNSNRTVLSIQNRWTTIKKAVSKFCAILAGIRRRNESSKNDRDRINEAIAMFEESKPWHFRHCWEMLRDEPKWNEYMTECSKPKQAAQGSHQPGPSDTNTATMPGGEERLPRPEGRDSAKRRRGKGPMEDTASSAAVEMLQKIHSRGQEMDEQDAKHRDEILQVEKAKLVLQEKALVAEIEQGDKKIELQREMSLEHIKLKRDMSLEHIKLKRDMMEVNILQTEVQIMFTDLNTCVPSMRYWIAKKQREILLRDGINPDDIEGAGAGGSSNNDGPSNGN